MTELNDRKSEAKLAAAGTGQEHVEQQFVASPSIILGEFPTFPTTFVAISARYSAPPSAQSFTSIRCSAAPKAPPRSTGGDAAALVFRSRYACHPRRKLTYNGLIVARAHV